MNNKTLHNILESKVNYYQKVLAYYSDLLGEYNKAKSFLAYGYGANPPKSDYVADGISYCFNLKSTFI